MKIFNKKKPIINVINIFNKKNFFQSYLLAEREFTLALGDLKVIPKNSAFEIAKKCNINLYNLNKIEKEIDQTKSPIATLANFISKKCKKKNQGFVHYGATTHNIMHTGMTLILRNSHIQSMFRISDCLKILSKLSYKHSNTVMIARTNGQHSMPITFGFKISEWAELILRLEERFSEIEKRLFILIFGGAVGAMHSFKGKKGPLYNNLCKRLNLNKVIVPSRSLVDNVSEYILLCSHSGSIFKKIATELSFHMREEIKEVFENQDKKIIGSSTMPQKINPKYVYRVIALAKEIESCIFKGVNMMETQNEGDFGTQFYQIKIIGEFFPKFNIMLDEFNNLLKKLVINNNKMLENISLTQNLIYSENVTMALAPVLGKKRAYEITSKIIKSVRKENSDFKTVICNNKKIKKILKSKEIDQLFDYKKNIGNSDKIAKKISKILETRSIKLKNRVQRIDGILNI